MTIGPAPICLFCKHYHQANQEANTCAAYPDGIPQEIILCSADHRRPYEGDNGLRFSPADRDADLYAIDLFGSL